MAMVKLCWMHLDAIHFSVENGSCWSNLDATCFRIFSAEDARLQQITDVYGGQSLEAPIHAKVPRNILRIYHRLPWQLQHVSHPWLCNVRPSNMKIDLNHVQQAPSRTVEKFWAHAAAEALHCHGPHSNPKEGHLAVRQQHSGGGSGVLAASVTWLRVDLMRVQKENLVIKEMEVSNPWGYPQISHL